VKKRSRASEDDLVVSQILRALTYDFANHPEHLQPIDQSIVTRINSLVGSIEVDLDAPLSRDDE